MQYIRLISVILIGLSTIKAAEIASPVKFDLWGREWEHKVDWYDMSDEQKAFALERYKSNIEYSLKNIGQKFSDVDMSKMGSDKGYKNIVPFVTYGLIALKYQDDYYHSQKAAKYFYTDWLEYKKHERGQKALWFEGPGDYNPLASAIWQWKEAGMYSEALRHYEEYFEDSFLGRIRGPKGRKISKEEEIKKLKEEMKYDTELKSNYDNFMQEWRETKKLAKTEKPKPLDPAVQNHEWFYSDKQEEVLKALDYYRQNKVLFMLEKALKRKDKMIADKAKEYLKELGKVKENVEKAK